MSADGDETDILSTLGTETVKSDSRAFSELMKHIRQKDADQQTVLMVQVENEVGNLGRGRDRSNSLTAGLQPGTGSNASMDLGFVGRAERQSRRENLQKEALCSP